MKRKIARILVVSAYGIFLFFNACSSAPKITKWTSPTMRIAIDPQSIDSANYVRIQEALVQSGKYFVVDRGDGFSAVVREEDMEQTGNPDRFGNEDRYARLARLYGVGAIVVANAQCSMKNSWLSGNYAHCIQSLALVDATTAEVIAQVRGENDDADTWYGDIKTASNWDSTVEKLNDAVPKTYVPSQYNERMRLYRKELREDAIRGKEASK